MPDHLRKQIRVAAAGALNNLPATTTNVFRSRLEDIADANLPALRIYTRNEDVPAASLGVNRVLERNLELIVEGCAKANTALDDTLDQIALEVEGAIAANQGIGGAKSVTLSRTDIDMDAEAEKDRGVIRMTFNVNYYAAINEPDVAL